MSGIGLTVVFFVRQNVESKEYSGNALDLLLWPATRHLLTADSHRRALSCLNDPKSFASFMPVSIDFSIYSRLEFERSRRRHETKSVPKFGRQKISLETGESVSFL